MKMVEFAAEDMEEASSESLVNVTIKMTKDEKEMLTRISKKERRNMASLGAIILVEWMEKYIEEYTASKE